VSLDTSIVVDVRRGEPAVVDWEAELDTGRSAVVTAIRVI